MDKALISDVADLIRDMATIDIHFEITNAEAIAEAIVRCVRDRRPPVDYFQEGFSAWHMGLQQPNVLTADQAAEWKRGWDEAVHRAMKAEFGSGS